MSPYVMRVGSRMWRRVLPFFVGLGLCLVLAGMQMPLAAQSITSGRVSEILDSDQVFIQDAIARVNDTATQGQRVRTGNARAQINFNTGAVARLASNSVLTIGQCANLRSGTLLVNGSINGCTPSTVAGVRGTTYLLTVTEDGQESIKVLEGEVVLTKNTASLEDSTPEVLTLENPTLDVPPTDSTAEETGLGVGMSDPMLGEPNAGGEASDTLTLTAGEKVQIREGEDFGPVERLTVDDFIEILVGELFNAFVSDLPGMDQIRTSFSRLFPGVPFPGSSVAPTITPPTPRPGLPF
jgi:hypothetical protein